MVKKSTSPWAMAKASAGHSPPVDRHQNSRRKGTRGIDGKRQMEDKTGKRKKKTELKKGAKMTEMHSSEK